MVYFCFSFTFIISSVAPLTIVALLHVFNIYVGKLDSGVQIPMNVETLLAGAAMYVWTIEIINMVINLVSNCKIWHMDVKYWSPPNQNHGLKWEMDYVDFCFIPN